MTRITRREGDALWSAAEHHGSLAWRRIAFARKHDLRSRYPIAWSGFGGWFIRRTIDSLRRKGMIRGRRGVWDWHLTSAGWKAASSLARERDPGRAALWLGLSERYP